VRRWRRNPAKIKNPGLSAGHSQSTNNRRTRRHPAARPAASGVAPSGRLSHWKHVFL